MSLQRCARRVARDPPLGGCGRVNRLLARKFSDELAERDITGHTCCARRHYLCNRRIADFKARIHSAPRNLVVVRGSVADANRIPPAHLDFGIGDLRASQVRTLRRHVLRV
jgi:hypothetical protein